MKATSKALARFGLDESAIERSLGTLLGHKIDDGDIYLEHIESEAISLEEGIVKRAARSVSQGAGIRAVAGERTGYAHSNELAPEELDRAAKAARAIAERSHQDQTVALKPQTRHATLYQADQPALGVPLQAKLDLLSEIDIIARQVDPRIQQVLASITSEVRHVVIASADGRITVDRRPLTRLNVTCVAHSGSDKQTGTAGGGGRLGFDFFLEGGRFKGYVEEAARRALLLLNAQNSPAGTMDVVLGPGWPGILLHEAIGHGLEGDFNRKGTSAFSGLVGTAVASPLVTVVDDGTLVNQRGSLHTDDEGTPTQRNVLIKDGVLCGYMQDRLNGRLMGEKSTGNGRRQSYAHAPMPRMTNTFMCAGQEDPADIIRGVKRGIYAVSFGGGQVDITSGKFTFSGSEAYLIEDGKVTAPIKGATFIGNGPDVLKRVTAVGRDMALDPGIGTCGKEGQSVPVTVGLPTIRINDLTVGGIAV